MRNEGFMLTEALVALLAVSVILIAVFTGFSAAIRASSLGLQQAKAASLGLKYANKIKSGASVPEVIHEGKYKIVKVNKTLSDGSPLILLEIYHGREKCITMPVK